MNSKISMLFLAALTVHIHLQAWVGRMLPIAKHPDYNNEWAILLGKDAGKTTWSDFKEENLGKESKETAQEIALNALQSQTGQVYNFSNKQPNVFSLKSIRNDGTTNYFHVVPVKYISDKVLFNKTNPKKDTFKWMLVSEAKKDENRANEQRGGIDPSTYWFITNKLDEAITSIETQKPELFAKPTDAIELIEEIDLIGTPKTKQIIKPSYAVEKLGAGLAHVKQR